MSALPSTEVSILLSNSSAQIYFQDSSGNIAMRYLPISQSLQRYSFDSVQFRGLRSISDDIILAFNALSYIYVNSPAAKLLFVTKVGISK